VPGSFGTPIASRSDSRTRHMVGKLAPEVNALPRFPSLPAVGRLPAHLPSRCHPDRGRLPASEGSADRRCCCLSYRCAPFASRPLPRGHLVGSPVRGLAVESVSLPRCLVRAPCFSRGELDFQSSGRPLADKLGFSPGISLGPFGMPGVALVPIWASVPTLALTLDTCSFLSVLRREFADASPAPRHK